jgi:hypothetical protein
MKRNSRTGIKEKLVFQKMTIRELTRGELELGVGGTEDIGVIMPGDGGDVPKTQAGGMC